MSSGLHNGDDPAPPRPPGAHRDPDRPQLRPAARNLVEHRTGALTLGAAISGSRKLRPGPEPAALIRPLEQEYRFLINHFMLIDTDLVGVGSGDIVLDSGFCAALTLWNGLLPDDALRHRVCLACESPCRVAASGGGPKFSRGLSLIVTFYRWWKVRTRFREETESGADG